jgi:hypothetical protein
VCGWLCRSLKESDSPIAVSREPKCYVDTGICTVRTCERGWELKSFER